MITLSRIVHHAELRIKLAFDYDFEIKEKIKQLGSARFSSSLGAWHITYSKEEYNAFLRLKIPFEIQKPGTTGDIESTGVHTGIEGCPSNSAIPQIDALDEKTEEAKDDESQGILRQPKQSFVPEGLLRQPKKDADIVNPVSVELHNTVFHIRTKYHEGRIQKIRRLHSAWWHKGEKVWIAKASIENLQKLQEDFNLWNQMEYMKWYELIALVDDPMLVELYRTPDNSKHIWVKLKGHKVDVDFMKHLPDRNYDKTYKRWSVPNEKVIVHRIITHFEEKGAQVINRLPELNKNVYNKTNYSPGQKQKHLIDKFDKKYQALVEEVSSVMIAQRYSWKTIRSYIGNLVHYAVFLQGQDIHKASAQDANSFIATISNRDVSESKINLVISSVKFFYDKVIFRPDFEIEKIKRPRKSKRLPYILSKGEIEKILQALQNVKHVAILYTLYSSGIRLSEILHLKVDDVYFDRDQLFIRGGKGRKDRVVMLSDVLKRLLILYTEEYKPIYWLFEGQDRKKQYSAGSVQKVVKNAARQAGLTKKVTPHQIRHCFATHLLDGGTDIRFIQELLGHKDIKTTLVYTHVTTKSLNSIKSPLDNLDLSENLGKKPER